VQNGKGEWLCGRRAVRKSRFNLKYNKMATKDKTPKNVPQRCMKCTYHPINRQLISKTENVPCYACQGGGCPVCMGYGHLTQNVNVIEKTLEVLWQLKNDDKFYFMTYGKDLLERIKTGEM